MNMTSDPNTDLNPEERSSLSESRTEYAPPAQVEARIMSEMRRRGLAASVGRWGHRQILVGLIILAFVFALGFNSKRLMKSAIADPRPHFMLLLYEDPGRWVGASADHEKRVKEYGDWARALAKNGSLVNADELSTPGVTLTDLETAGGLVGQGQAAGFFIVAARDESEALRIARTCPHLRYGGRVVVQKVLI
jgi:hypothetical protein